MEPVVPASWVDLGLMQGSPPPPDKRATLANWQRPPFNRWAFAHVRELIPTARIHRGDGPVYEFMHDLRDLDDFTFEHEGRTWTWREMVNSTYTDGIVVVRDDAIIYEWYVEGFTPDHTHLLQSVSKSLTATLTGVLAGHGRLDPDDLVTGHVEELRGTALEGCTIQHLLDMRAGIRFTEDYDDPEADVCIFEPVALWGPRTRDDLPEHLYAYMTTLQPQGEHGGAFDYRSILTDLLGWVCERAGGGRFADLFSEHIWSRIGAERDAEVTVDTGGAPLADGGICVTTRDLARFGWMHLNEGELGGEQVVPAWWIQRLHRPDEELARTYLESTEDQSMEMYHDKWWVWDSRRGIYSGYGIYGQQLLIHRPSRTVIAKHSTMPVAGDSPESFLQDAGLGALCESFVDSSA